MSTERDSGEMAPVFSEKEEVILRAAHERLDQELGINSKTPEHLIARFESRLGRQYPSENSGRTFGWKALIAYICSAFALGVTITRVVMLPTMEATRAIDSQSRVATDGDRVLRNTEFLKRINEDSVQKVVVKVDDPIATAQLVSKEAIRLGLEIFVERDKSTCRVLIDGFVPYSADQEVLRSVLGISKTASGKILFSLTKKIELP